MAIKNVISPKYIVQDAAEVFILDAETKKLVVSTEQQMTSISQTVEEQQIQGGIGAAPIALIQTQKTIETTFRNAVWSLDYIAMGSGTEYEEGLTVPVYSTRKGIVTDDAGTKIVKIDGLTGLTTGSFNVSEGTETQQINAQFTDGESEDLTALLTGITDGTEVSVYIREEKEGSGVKLRADKFPKKFEIIYKTVAYDPTTMAHVKDIMIHFYEAQASANFDLALEMSTPLAPEIAFTVTKREGCNELGRIVAVDPDPSTETDC